MPKAEALRQMKLKHPDEVAQLPTNPFPDALTVVPKQGDDIEKVAALFSSQPGNGIDKVDYGKKTTHKVLRLAHVIEAFFIIAVLLLLAASTLLIANTIRLSIFSRRREIEVMKLVGATNWFVRGQFMLEGVLCGVAGAIGAVILLILGKEIALPSLLHTGSAQRGQRRAGTRVLAERSHPRRDGSAARRRGLRPHDQALPPGLTGRPRSRPGREARQARRGRAVLRAGHAARARPERARRRRPGDLAVVRTGRGRARLERVLGKAKDIEVVLEGLLEDSGDRTEFEPWTEPAHDGDRVDLRDLLTFTIDPETAKDFDDALSVEEEGGGYRAWVHIADVSAYVAPGTPLKPRRGGAGFTTYVPGRAAPMLPPELADDRCSLRPHEDRLCVTVELPPEGEPRFYRSVIRSDARLTYGQAERREAAPEIAAALERTDRLTAAIRERRFARGALRIESPEVAFAFDGHGSIARAWKESEPTSHRLVEELMIAANEAVARLLSSRRREALYRVHERPDPQAIELFQQQLDRLRVGSFVHAVERLATA